MNALPESPNDKGSRATRGADAEHVRPIHHMYNSRAAPSVGRPVAYFIALRSTPTAALATMS